VNARREMLAAQKNGDRDSEELWTAAMNKFLDTYAREKDADFYSVRKSPD
jgi:hypothetical protein